MIAEINGTRVFYETAGETGPRVVLLHGWGCSMELMRPVAESLKADHRVLMLDFPGHGKSSTPPEPWGVPEYAACLLELLRRINFIPCSVVAHSFGCRVTALLAARETAVFEKLVLTGAAGLKKKTTVESEARSSQYQKKKQWVQRVRKIPGMSGLADRIQEQLIQKYGSEDYKKLDPEMRKTFNLVIQQDLRDCYAKIRQSTLLIWGENDMETPLWMGREIEALIPDAGLVVFEGGDHFAYLQELQRFNVIIKSFL